MKQLLIIAAVFGMAFNALALDPVQVDAWAIGEGLGLVVGPLPGNGVVVFSSGKIESWGLTQPKPESWPSVEDAKATVKAYKEPGNAGQDWWHQRSHAEKCLFRCLYQHAVDQHGYTGTFAEFLVAKVKPEWDKD